MRTIHCHCDKSFEADVPDTLDLSSDAGLLARIAEGDFMTFTCPHCGARVKPEFPVRVKGASQGRDIQVLPEIERLALYAGKGEVPAGCEALVGYPELIERARLLRDGLDPEASEIVKFYLLGRAEEANPDADLAVLYAGSEEGKLVYHLYGAREGETGVLRVPGETYRGVLADKRRKMQEEPFKEIFKGPYRAVRALEASEDEED